MGVRIGPKGEEALFHSKSLYVGDLRFRAVIHRSWKPMLPAA